MDVPSLQHSDINWYQANCSWIIRFINWLVGAGSIFVRALKTCRKYPNYNCLGFFSSYPLCLSTNWIGSLFSCLSLHVFFCLDSFSLSSQSVKWAYVCFKALLNLVIFTQILYAPTFTTQRVNIHGVSAQKALLFAFVFVYIICLLNIFVL